jgi:hypothetical protein
MLLEDELGRHRRAEKHRSAFVRPVAETQKICNVLSLSEMGDQLSQWRAYCPGGNGYALGFGQSNAIFASARQHSFDLVHCVSLHRNRESFVVTWWTASGKE